MTATMSLAFKKMNGLGNAFVVLDGRDADPALIAARGKRIAKDRADLAYDQLIVIERSGRGDAFARFFNADGSEAGACGNGARCVAWLLSEEAGRPDVTIETRAGLLGARVEGLDRVTVDMGEPRFGWAEIPLSRPVGDTRAIVLEDDAIRGLNLGPASAVGVGNPHAIFWVDDPWRHDLAGFGPALERHPLFPERVNVTLAAVLSRESLRVRTWERGAGLTKACGTAACATAVAAARMGFTERRVAVTLPGGALRVEWTAGNRILMTGPAELEFEGEISVETAP